MKTWIKHHPWWSGIILTALWLSVTAVLQVLGLFPTTSEKVLIQTVQTVGSMVTGLGPHLLSQRSDSKRAADAAESAAKDAAADADAAADTAARKTDAAADAAARTQ